MGGRSLIFVLLTVLGVANSSNAEPRALPEGCGLYRVMGKMQSAVESMTLLVHTGSTSEVKVIFRPEDSGELLRWRGRDVEAVVLLHKALSEYEYLAVPKSIQARGADPLQRFGIEGFEKQRGERCAP